MARRGGKKFGKSKKPRSDDRDDPTRQAEAKTYQDVVRENLAFETYYKAQRLTKDDQEWSQLMDTLRRPLPAAFRINAFCFGQTQALKNLVESHEFGNLTINTSGTDESNIVPLKWYPNGLAYQMRLSRTEIRKSERLQKLHSFLVSESENGYISRQEAVSMIPPIVLDVQPGHRVLDLCAAPGSKTAQIIEFLHAGDSPRFDLDQPVEPIKPMDGVVVANDVDNGRCYMLVHQSKRLNSPAFIITNHDAGNIPRFYENATDDGQRRVMKFDRIVCDVPCSGDGTIRKNIDVWSKWNVSNGNNFNGIQTRIAKKALELLGKDGLMVYSTCSFNPMENEAVVSTLLNESQGAIELVPIADQLKPLKFIPGLSTWTVMRKDLTVIPSFDEVEEPLRTQIRANMFPPTNADQLHLDRCVRVLPHLQDTGGFFIALIRKLVDRMPWEADEKPDVIENHECQSATNSSEPEPPVKKICFARRSRGFKEDPFYFLKQDDPEWSELENYYGISRGFPFTQLMHRTEKINRNIYYLTAAAKKMINSNDSKVKFVNAGVRMFAKVQDKASNCLYRVTQEGLPILYPYLNQSKIVNVQRDEFYSILSADECVQNETFSQQTQDRLSQIGSGCCIVQYSEQVLDPITGQSNLMRLPISAWKGKLTTRPYICKSERLHFLRLCKFDISVFETEQKRIFDAKQERRLARQNQHSAEVATEETESKANGNELTAGNTTESTSNGQSQTMQVVD